MVRKDVRGLALPLVLVLLMGLTLFAQGALLLSRQELQATWAFRNLIRAQQAAEIGLHLASTLPPDSVGPASLWRTEPVLSGETAEGLRYSVVRRGLGSGYFLLEATGGIQGWEGERRIVRVGRAQPSGSD